MFESKFPDPPLPSCDVFNYIFHHGRRPYPWGRVLYRVDGTNEQLTLGELERASRQLANALKNLYQVKPGDVVSVFAEDKVSCNICWALSCLDLFLNLAGRGAGQYPPKFCGSPTDLNRYNFPSSISASWRWVPPSH